MKKSLIIVFTLICFANFSPAQTIRVNPTGVNVNSQNPTVVSLVFGQIPPGYVPAEALWCGELIPAPAPALGLQCRPDSVFGTLPARYNRAQTTGNLGLSDIMAIPTSVVRRAYQSAVAGENAGFFYVRRFVSTTGEPDQFVNVTCRMTGGGARVPFALTNVEIKTLSNEPVLFLKPGEKFPKISVEIQYNGTGRLKGRWEIVQPGEESPNEFDLLTEATLPIEKRGTQKRFMQVSRFNHFLPPGSKFTLNFGENERVPTNVEGQYILLLRIEATDDKESDTNLAAVGAGGGVVHNGAVAGFPMPSLKYFVVGKSDAILWEIDSHEQVSERNAAEINKSVVFSWKPLPSAALYKLEFFDDRENVVLSALLLPPVTAYQMPSWFREQWFSKKIEWRVVAINSAGKIAKDSKKQQLIIR